MLPRKKSKRLYVALTGVALLGALLAIFAYATYWAYSRNVEERLELAGRILDVAATSTTNIFSNAEGILQRATVLWQQKDPSDVSRRTIERLREAALERQPEYFDLRIWAPDGQSFFPGSEMSGISVANRDFFLAHKKSSAAPDPSISHRTLGYVIGAPIFGRIQQKHLIPVSKAIRSPSGEIEAVMVVSVPASLLLETFAHMLPHPNDTIFMFRNDKTGVVRIPENEKFTGQKLENALIWQSYPKQQNGSFRGNAQTDGIYRVGVHRGLAPIPLVIGLSFDVAPLSMDVLSAHFPIAAVTLMALILAAGYVAVSYYVLKSSEFYQTQYRESSQRLSAVLQTASDGIIILDEKLHITMFNAAAEKIFRTSASEVCGGTLDRFIPPAFRDAHEGMMRKMLAEPDGSREMGSWRRISGLDGTGREFPLMSSISKVTVGSTTVLTAIVRDMTDVRDREQSLMSLASEQTHLRELAEQAVKAKTMFLATMSHELRTPLNAIIGFSETMNLEIFGPLGSSRYKEYVDDIVRSGRHLLALINDILDLSKISASTKSYYVEEIDVEESLSDAIMFVTNAAKEKGIQIRFDGCREKCVVRADARGLTQIFLNLLSNAIKFTPPHGSCFVNLVADGAETVEVTVRDTGPGMPGDLLQRVGEPFLQMRDAYQSSASGTGLGLAIVSELTKAFGGEFSLRNAEDGGLIATLRLKRCEAEVAQPA